MVAEGSDRLAEGRVKVEGAGAAPAEGRAMSAPPRSRDRRPSPPEDPRQIATGMTLADISIRNHVFAWMLMFALIGFGTSATPASAACCAAWASARTPTSTSRS